VETFTAEESGTLRLGRGATEDGRTVAFDAGGRTTDNADETALATELTIGAIDGTTTALVDAGLGGAATDEVAGAGATETAEEVAGFGAATDDVSGAGATETAEEVAGLGGAATDEVSGAGATETAEEVAGLGGAATEDETTGAALVAGFGAITLLTGATSEDATETTGAGALESLGTADSITEEATESTYGAETFGKTTVTLVRGTTNVVALDQTDVDLGTGATSLLVEFGASGAARAVAAKPVVAMSESFMLTLEGLTRF
jgi:hypothetical protein